MIVQRTEDEMQAVLTAVGLALENGLLGMHLSEIEEEAENILETLSVLRAYAWREDENAGQETLAELTISLEHLLGHVQHAVPILQEELDLQ
ncbi:MAG: hypothetical protein KJZ86_13285 [Caldilineaceae bacterium]|nr:hypothetical protein [Caldilineaceae bacterium]HRJ44500.1 hypothetical protein [Caldilineaceae bacterium]